MIGTLPWVLVIRFAGAVAVEAVTAVAITMVGMVAVKDVRQLVTAERHLPPKCTNFGFFYGTVQILGHHVMSRTPLAVHPCCWRCCHSW